METVPPRFNFASYSRVIFWALAIAAGILILPRAAQAQSQGSLNFFKNYFITGDYVIGGVGLRGTGTLDPVTGQKLATGTITINGVPAGADILAAILYWQAIDGSSVSAPAVGYFGTSEDAQIIGKQIAPEGVQSCWGSGGGNGTTSGASWLRSYRSSVLHLLPTDPATGKRVANGSHTVRVADSGSGGSQSPSSGNQVNLAQGASLLIVYRDPIQPLRAIIVYDGGKVLNQQFTSMSQSMYGYFQASSAGANAKITQLVGDGDPNFGEQLSITGDPTATSVVANPFTGSAGFSWDNPTYNVSLTAGTLQESQPISATTVSTGSSVDCLSWTAMIARVDVQDGDYDGLLDRWETSASTLTNPANSEYPTGQPLPPINLMGANKDVQDIFIEIGFLELTGTTGYDTPLGHVDPHTHLPPQNVLSMVATMFHNAPGGRKFGMSGPINLHFDVGNRYQASSTFNYAACQVATTWTPQCSIIPASVARGGEKIEETDLESEAFPGFFGVIGWKSAFDVLRDQPLNYSTEAACAASSSCQRRFDENRMHVFKYAFFGHALGVPRGLSGTALQTPRTTSGVADGGDGGGDVLITLGFWDGSTGTELVQAGTFAHELGHTLGLRHGGPAPTLTDKAPNCKPNYLSVMNYFFQVRGLRLPSGAIIDFSREVQAPVYEKSLSDTVLPTPYLTRWYAPAGNWLATAIGMSPAERYCDGGTAPPTMVRVDGTTPGAIDWNFNGAVDAGPATQDANFDGITNGITGEPDVALGEKLNGFNDWENIDLRQTASRRNFNGLSLEMTLEDTGLFDWTDGTPPFGAFDWGAFDWGAFDWGAFDWGAFDWGAFDWGTAEGAFDWGGPLDNSPRGDLDFLTAASHGNPPTNLRYTTTNKSIDLAWNPPTVAKPKVGDTYQVWRAAGNVPMSPTNLPLKIGTTTVSATDPALAFSDTTAKTNAVYWYFVTVTVNSKQSGPSEVISASKK